MRNWGNVNFCAAVCLLLLGGSPPLSSALHRQRRVAGENDLWGNPCDYTGVSISSEDQKEIAEELVKQAKLALERAEPYKDILASQLDSYSKFEDLLKLYEGEAWLRDFPWYKDAVLPKQKKLHSPIDAKYINKILGDSLDHDLPAIHKGLKMIVAGMWAFKTVGLNDGIEYDDALKQGIDNTMSDSSAVLCHMSDLMTARGIASWPLLEDEIPNLTTENKLKMEVLIYRDTLNYLEYIQQLFQQFIELQDYKAEEIYGPQITEKDGALLDEHDSFYLTTKSLLVLFQIMGVMPIMRVPRNAHTTKRTTFNWISKATLWAYVIWGLESIIVVKVGKERLENFQNSSSKRFDEVIYNIIFLSILIPHFLLPIASWRHGPQVAIFKNMWTHYQLKYLKITGTPIIFPNLYYLTWGLCVFSWGLSFAVILSQHYLQDDFELWHSLAYYHIIAMLDGFCSLWYINCNAFGTASKGLAMNLHKALEAEHPALKLAQYRHLWVDLSHMMQQLGRAYSNMYGIYCMVIFFTTTISLYGVLSEVLERGLSYKELGLFVIVGYCMTLLFIICNEAYHASRKVGLEFQVRLLNVNLGAIDRSTQREVEMFLVAISKNPPIMNLDGFTNINRELFTANISFMSTYLIVLMQFKLTLLRQSARKAIKTVIRAIFNTTTTLADITDDEDEE